MLVRSIRSSLLTAALLVSMTGGCIEGLVENKSGTSDDGNADAGASTSGGSSGSSAGGSGGDYTNSGDGGGDSGASDTCQIPCTYDYECSTGESCVDTTVGNICIPSGCVICFNQDLSCYSDPTTCEFFYCG